MFIYNLKPFLRY